MGAGVLAEQPVVSLKSDLRVEPVFESLVGLVNHFEWSLMGSENWHSLVDFDTQVDQASALPFQEVLSEGRDRPSVSSLISTSSFET